MPKNLYSTSTTTSISAAKLQHSSSKPNILSTCLPRLAVTAISMVVATVMATLVASTVAVMATLVASTATMALA